MTRSPKEQRDARTMPQLCRDAGITRKQAHEWRKLAAIPETEFDAMLAAPDRNRRIAAVKKGAVGGRGRTARPADRLLDALLALELQCLTLDHDALRGLPPEQRTAFARVIPALLDSLLTIQRSLDHDD